MATVATGSRGEPQHPRAGRHSRNGGRESRAAKVPRQGSKGLDGSLVDGCRESRSLPRVVRRQDAGAVQGGGRPDAVQRQTLVRGWVSGGAGTPRLNADRNGGRFAGVVMAQCRKPRHWPGDATGRAAGPLPRWRWEVRPTHILRSTKPKNLPVPGSSCRCKRIEAASAHDKRSVRFSHLCYTVAKGGDVGTRMGNTLKASRSWRIAHECPRRESGSLRKACHQRHRLLKPSCNKSSRLQAKVVYAVRLRRAIWP